MQLKNIFALKLLKKYKPNLVVIFDGYGAEETKELINFTLSGFMKTFQASSPKFFYELHKYLGGFWGILQTFIFFKPFPKVFILLDSPRGINYKLLKSISKVDTIIVLPKADLPTASILFSSSYTYVKDAMNEVKTSNFVVFNADDETTRDLIEDLSVQQISYGFDTQADISVASVHNQLYASEYPSGGMNIKIDYDDNFIPVNANNIFGKRSTYAVCSALAVAMRYGINFIDASTRISEFKGSFNFLKLINGIKNTSLLVHIRNISAQSALEAIEVSKHLKEEAGSKLVVVLGDIVLNNLQEAESLHRNLGEITADLADPLFLLGERIVFTEEEAKKFGMPADKLHRFMNAQAMSKKIKEILTEKDVVLVLGSEETHMKKVINFLKK